MAEHGDDAPAPPAAGPRVGPWIHDLLVARGIDIAFGIPGVHTVPLYDGLAETPGTDALRHVTPRHEQGAGFMADGYARVAGRPAACFVITGPGVTNIATALGQAYADSVPMLVLSSVSRRRHIGRGGGQLHELRDQRALTAGVTAFSHTLQALEDLPALLDRAVAVFRSERPRPVHIEIPLDLWEEAPPGLSLPPGNPQPGRPTEEALDDAAGALARARRPVILAGGGARSAVQALRTLAEGLDAPVVMTANGRGLMPPDHPLAVPASPSLAPVRTLMTESDAVLAVGTELGPTDYDMYETGMPTLPTPLIRLDIDPAQMAAPQAADIALLGAAAATLPDLDARIRHHRQADRKDGGDRAHAARDAAWAALEPPMRTAVGLLDTIRETLPDALLVGDSTHPIYAGNLYFAAEGPGSWFNSATGYGTLGYALPAAIGAALAAPDRPVVCLVGDGGLHYSLGELASLRQTGAKVIVLVWNNACYGEIKHFMTAEGVAPVGVDLFTPDLENLARAYGLYTGRLKSPNGLARLLLDAIAADEPSLIRVDEAVALAQDTPA